MAMFESLFKRMGYAKIESAEAPAELDPVVVVPCPGCPSKWQSADGLQLPLTAPEDSTTPGERPAIEPQAHRAIPVAPEDHLAAIAEANDDRDEDQDEWEWQMAMARARSRETEEVIAKAPVAPPAPAPAPVVNADGDEEWEWQMAMARARVKAEDQKPMPRPPRRRARGSQPPFAQHAKSHAAITGEVKAAPATPRTTPNAEVTLRNAKPAPREAASPVSALLQRQLKQGSPRVGRSPRTARVKRDRMDRARVRRSHAPTVASPKLDSAKQPKQAITERTPAPLPRFTTSRANRS